MLQQPLQLLSKPLKPPVASARWALAAFLWSTVSQVSADKILFEGCRTVPSPALLLRFTVLPDLSSRWSYIQSSGCSLEQHLTHRHNKRTVFSSKLERKNKWGFNFKQERKSGVGYLFINCTGTGDAGVKSPIR